MLNKIMRFLFELLQRKLARCASVAIIIEDGNSVLLFERNDGRGYSLPGGLVEHGEKVEVAAQRELQEETGIIPLRLEYLNLYDEPEKDKCLVHVFEAKLNAGQLKKDCREGTAVWIAKEKLLEEEAEFLDNMAFGNGCILRQYFHELKSEVHNHASVELTSYSDRSTNLLAQGQLSPA